MSEHLKSNWLTFEKEVIRRKITRLVHFTPAINLISIFERGGLVSREGLKELSDENHDLYLDHYTKINDSYRFDGLLDYINLSIQCPNYFLLNRFRSQLDEEIESWCVISVSPQCIWYKDSLFSVGNAASNLSKQYGVRGCLEGFKDMFRDEVIGGSVERKVRLNRNGIADCYPTDVQAEVLVKGRIDLKNIQEVYFENLECADSLRAAISLLVDVPLPPFVENPQIFLKG